jgi:hypothetical protein
MTLHYIDTVLLSVVILSVVNKPIMLGGIMLSVVAPHSLLMMNVFILGVIYA